jgi:hypothetical protein
MTEEMMLDVKILTVFLSLLFFSIFSWFRLSTQTWFLGLCQIPDVCDICRLYRSWPAHSHTILVSDIHIAECESFIYHPFVIKECKCNYWLYRYRLLTFLCEQVMAKNLCVK